MPQHLKQNDRVRVEGRRGESFQGILEALLLKPCLTGKRPYQERSMGERVCSGVMAGRGDYGQFLSYVWLDLQGQSCLNGPPFPRRPDPGGKDV